VLTTFKAKHWTLPLAFWPGCCRSVRRAPTAARTSKFVNSSLELQENNRSETQKIPQITEFFLWIFPVALYSLTHLVCFKRLLPNAVALPKLHSLLCLWEGHTQKDKWAKKSACNTSRSPTGRGHFRARASRRSTTATRFSQHEAVPQCYQHLCTPNHIESITLNIYSTTEIAAYQQLLHSGFTSNQLLPSTQGLGT